MYVFIQQQWSVTLLWETVLACAKLMECGLGVISVSQTCLYINIACKASVYCSPISISTRILQDIGWQHTVCIVHNVFILSPSPSTTPPPLLPWP